MSAEIEAIHTRLLGTSGEPRIHAELADEGTRFGRKRVTRLIGAAGLVGVSRRQDRPPTYHFASLGPRTE